MLKGSCLSRCNDSMNLMNFVKAFFLTSGFPTPRAIVYFNSELIQMMMRSAADQDPLDPTIYSPQTIREEVAIREAILIAKDLNEAERQVDAALSATYRGGNGLAN